MSSNDSAKATDQLSQNQGVVPPVIYADRIINFGVGASVSRITLGMEIGENSFVPVAQVVVPSPSLFEALQVIATKLETDDAMKKGIVDALDAFKHALTKVE